MKKKTAQRVLPRVAAIGNLSEQASVLYGGPVPSPDRVGVTPHSEVAGAVLFSTPQAIVCDWAEMHFRLKDPGLFGQLNTQQPPKQAADNKHASHAEVQKWKLMNTAREPVEKLVAKNFTLKRVANGTSFYQDTYDVWAKNKRFAQLWCNPRSEKQIALNDVQIKIYNNLLYEQGWNATLQELSVALDMQWHNFTRLDIAVDGGSWFDVYNKLEQKDIMQVGRATRNKYSSHKGEITGWYLGMSKSKKRIKCYNKTKELNRSNKLYVEKWWKLNGIDRNKRVERLELMVRNEESKKFEDLDWKRLDDPAHIAGFMRSNMEKFCEFRIPEKGKNVSRWKKLDIVNWSQLQGNMMAKNSTRPTNEIWSAKVSIKKLFEVTCVTGDRHYEGIAWEFALNSGLISWYEKMQPKWAKDIAIKQGHNRFGVIQDSWITTFHSYNPGEQIRMPSDEEERKKYLAAAGHLN